MAVKLRSGIVRGKEGRTERTENAKAPGYERAWICVGTDKGWWWQGRETLRDVAGDVCQARSGDPRLAATDSLFGESGTVHCTVATWGPGVELGDSYKALWSFG